MAQHRGSKPEKMGEQNGKSTNGRGLELRSGLAQIAQV